ncbi:MAG: helix-turn-helix domain-containing protein [Verrucomicrobiota bacterium]
MSENDIVISVGSQKLVHMIGQVMKQTLSNHDMDRLKGIGPNYLFTRREVAEMFGLEYTSVRRMIERGTLEVTADCRYIPKSSIDKYLNKRNCLGSAGEQLRSMPEAKVSLQDESCRPGGADNELGIISALLSDPDLSLQKTRARAIEKNSKGKQNNNLNETK